MKNMKQMMPMMIIMLVIVVLGSGFALDGWQMHNRVATEEAAFHELQTDYFGNNTKADRDSAAAGSALNAQLAEIANYPSTLLELKLIGVGRILMGIFFLLFGILVALISMPTRLGKIIRGEQG